MAGSSKSQTESTYTVQYFSPTTFKFYTDGEYSYTFLFSTGCGSDDISGTYTTNNSAKLYNNPLYARIRGVYEEQLVGEPLASVQTGQIAWVVISLKNLTAVDAENAIRNCSISWSLTSISKNGRPLLGVTQTLELTYIRVLMPDGSSLTASEFLALHPSAQSQGSANTESVCSQDKDCDGISDDFELWLAQGFMPVFEYDEQEHNPITQTSGILEGLDVIYLYQVSEVKCGVNAGGTGGVNLVQFILEPKDTTKSLPSWITEKTSYLLTVVSTYQYDYLPYDPGPGEEDLFNHYGDTERVRICVVHDGDNYVARFLIINRHNEKDMYQLSKVPTWEGSHPYLFVSEGKHATFVSESECRGSVSASQIIDNPFEGDNWKWLGFHEDCGGGKVIRSTVLASYNVGEPYSFMPESGRVVLHDMAIAGGWPYDMDPFGIEVVWSAWADDSNNRDHYFCGGYNIDYYLGTHNVTTGYDSPWCAGQLANKWWDSSQ
jgi:hypothetical protein